MDSVWLNVDDAYDEGCDNWENSTFGVFTASPAEICRNLPRPETPFNAEFDFYQGKMEDDDVYVSRVVSESPPYTHSLTFERSNPFISVFD